MLAPILPRPMNPQRMQLSQAGHVYRTAGLYGKLAGASKKPELNHRPCARVGPGGTQDLMPIPSASFMRFARPAALALTFLLAGCHLNPACSDDNQPYQAARAVPSLKVPAGMDEPNRNSGLKVPPPAAPS